LEDSKSQVEPQASYVFRVKDLMSLESNIHSFSPNLRQSKERKQSFKAQIEEKKNMCQELNLKINGCKDELPAY